MNAINPVGEVAAPVSATTDGAGAMMAIINRAAFEVDFPIDRLEHLLKVKDQWEQKEAAKAFNAAIAAIRADIKPVLKNQKGHNNKAYADFSAYAEMLDPIIAKHGVNYRFKTTQNDKISVSCVVSHELGHSEENTLVAAADTTGNKNSIQAIGSTLTYLQRYTLCQAFGLAASDDDDGAKAEKHIVATLTQEQIDAIRDLLEAKGVEKDRFLKFGKVERIEDIAANQYEGAIKAINQMAAS